MRTSNISAIQTSEVDSGHATSVPSQSRPSLFGD